MLEVFGKGLADMGPCPQNKLFINLRTHPSEALKFGLTDLISESALHLITWVDMATQSVSRFSNIQATSLSSRSLG